MRRQQSGRRGKKDMNKALKEYAEKKYQAESTIKTGTSGGDKVRAFVVEHRKKYGNRNTASASNALTGGDKVRAFVSEQRQRRQDEAEESNIARIQALFEGDGKTYIPSIGTAREYTAAKQQAALSPDARSAGGFSANVTPSLHVSPQNEIYAAKSRAKREIYSGAKDAVRTARLIDTAKAMYSAKPGDTGTYKAVPADFETQGTQTYPTESELSEARKALNEAHAALTKTPNRESYAAYSEAYKNYNDLYQAFRSAGQRTTGENMGNVTGKSVWAGITDVTNAGWQLAALPFRFLGGAQEFLFPGSVNPLAEAGEYISNIGNTATDEATKLQQQAVEDAGGGAGYQFLGDVTRTLTAAVPQSAVAVATGGASAAAQTGNLANTGAKGLTALSNSILNMAKTPAYQSAFLFEFGQNYDDAKQKGADDGKALIYSVFTSGLNAAVEMGGGAESLPYGTKMRVSDVFLSSLGEGGEEILQDGISNVLDWAITDSDKPLFSTTDENAVFNPSRSGKAGLMGMVAGMALGGGSAVLNNINTASESKVNNRYGEIVTNAEGAVDSESVQAVIHEGLANDNPEIRKIAAQLNVKDHVTAEEAGYLYRRLVASEQAERGGIFDAEIGTAQNPATQDQLNAYVDYAYRYAAETNERGNKNFPKQKSAINLGRVSDRAAQETLDSFGVDISGYTQILTDNDIRHIKNSHGEQTKEKYPVTAEDIKKIPDIIENFDDVLYVSRRDGKAGIFFVKQHNGVTYYLEQMQGDGVLTGKQMIKVPTGTVPAVEGLKEAIQKKWGAAPLQMNNVPRMYVQDVWSDAPTISAKGASHAAANAEALNITPEAHLPYSADTYNIAQAEGESQADGGNLQADETYYNLSEDARTFFAHVMQKNGSVPGAREAFYRAYLEGYTGRTQTIDPNTFISKTAQSMAYELGAEDKAAVGTFKAVKGASVQAETAALFSRMAKDLNVSITYGGKAPVIDGMKINGYITQTGAIHIFENAVVELSDGRKLTGTDAARICILGHELTHRLQQTAPREYARFREMAVERYGGVWFSQEYAKRIGLSEAAAQDEMAADYAMEHLFTDNVLISEITKRHSRLALAIRNVLHWIREKLGIASSELDNAIRLWNNAYNAAMRNKNASDMETKDVRYSKHSDDSETLSIKQQLREHAQDLRDMEPVASIFSNGKDGISKLKWKEIILADFRSRGFKVDRQGFGIIEIGEPQVEKSLDYINTDAEYAAFQAVHRVLKRGKEISGHDNHKNRGYSSITFAAPIEINGIRGNMAVIVKQTGKNKYHTHRVLMPDGSAFIFQKETAEATPGRMTAVSDGESLPITSAINTNIAQDASGVNSEYMQKSEKDTDGVQASVTGTADIRAQGTAEHSAALSMAEQLADMEAASKNGGRRYTMSLDTFQRVANTYAGDVDEKTYSRFAKRLYNAAVKLAAAYHARGKAKTERYADAYIAMQDAAAVLERDRDAATDLAGEMTLAMLNAGYAGEASSKTARGRFMSAKQAAMDTALLSGREAERAHKPQISEEIRRLDERIDSFLLDRGSLRELAQRMRGEAYREYREKYAQWKAQYTENDTVQKARERIKKNWTALQKWADKPDRSGHSIPEVARLEILEMLSRIDVRRNAEGEAQSKEDIRFGERINRIADALAQYGEGGASAAESFAGDSFIPPAVLLKLKQNAAEIGGGSIYDMSRAELQRLDESLCIVKTLVARANELHVKGRTVELDLAAEAEHKRLAETKKSKTPALAMNLMDSFTYADEVGGLFGDMIKTLQNRFDLFVRATAEVRDFVSASVNHGLVETWRRNVRGVTLGGQNVYMTDAQLMSLYLLNKRKQAREHIYLAPGQDAGGAYSGGIQIDRANFKYADAEHDLRGDLQRWLKETKDESIGHITEQEIDNAVGLLSEEQKKVADALQQYMAKKLGALGNEVSMRMYGYYAFMEPDYFPIRTVAGSNKTTSQTGNEDNLYAVLNSSMTKRTKEHAQNALVVSDIFSVFTSHASDMLNYYAYAEAVSDCMRVYNFKSELSGRRLSEKLNSTYPGAGDFYLNQLRALNKQKAFGATDADGLIKKLMGNSKVAMVGLNLRVVVQQPTAILRAMAVVDPKYFVKAGKKISLKTVQKYCPIAQWKSWGFYDMNIGHDLNTLLFGNRTAFAEIKEKQMWLAGKADEITWLALWNVCEAEIKDKRKYLSAGSEAFMQAVGERLGEVINETQVVDTPFHRTQLARSKNEIVKASTAFMSEPMKSLNLLYRAKKRGQFFRAFAAVEAAQVLAAAFSALIDALRDDDDEKVFLEKYAVALGSNLLNNMNPLSWIPWGGEYLSHWSYQLAFGGVDKLLGTNLSKLTPKLYSSTGYEYEALDSFADAVDTLGNDNADWYEKVYNASQAVADITGIGIDNIFRDVVGSIYNISNGLSPKGAYKRAMALGNEEKAAENYQNFLSAKCEEIAGSNYGASYTSLSYADKKTVRKKAENSIKATTRSLFKDGYIKAWQSGDDDKITAIRRVLLATDLYSMADIKEMFSSYVRSYYKERYKEARTAEEKQEIIQEAARAKGRLTGEFRVFASYADAKKYLTE